MKLTLFKDKNTIEIFMCICSLLCFCLIIFLSSKSKLPQPIKPFFGLDKIMHCFAFGATAFAFSFWFSTEAWNTKMQKCILLTFTVIALFGISDEIHQYFVAGRSSSMYDWFADCFGAALACGLRAGIHIYVKHKKRGNNIK